jgi:hypothetical protein
MTPWFLSSQESARYVFVPPGQGDCPWTTTIKQNGFGDYYALTVTRTYGGGNGINLVCLEWSNT